MSFDHDDLAARIEAHGPVVRVVVTGTKGSSPRGAGTAMLVWEDGQSGTIGGGALEFEATKRARGILNSGPQAMQMTEPLGPALGQCCGGTVALVFERFDVGNLPNQDAHIFARQIDTNADATIPTQLQRRIDAAGNTQIPPTLINGWLAESLWQSATPVWIFGAGHVGRALANVLAPLPEFDITLIDTKPARMPAELPHGVTPLTAATMAGLAKHAPENAHHYIMTMSHGIDLEICHALLNHTFAYAGLIGSKTKWVRFRSRLEKLGHDPDEINRITCPIGDPALGKEPQAIAVSIAHRLLLERAQLESSTGSAHQTGET